MSAAPAHTAAGADVPLSAFTRTAAASALAAHRRRLVEYLYTTSCTSDHVPRSVTRVVDAGDAALPLVRVAIGTAAPLFLKPRAAFADPFKGDDAVIVVCDAHSPPDVASGAAVLAPHPTNTRTVCDAACVGAADEEPLLAVTQQYTIVARGGGGCGGFATPTPAAIMDAHLTTCLAAGLAMTGCRPESKPGQCSFSIGPLPPLDLADQLVAARYLLTRVADRAGAAAAFDGDSTTCSFKLSTRSTRADATGAASLADAVDALVGAHGGLVAAYGCSQPAATCVAGVEPPVSASIRIPAAVALHGRGHIEDRRPPGGVDPYAAAASLLCAALRQPLPQCVPHLTAATPVESAACSPPALSGAVAAGTPDTPPPRSHGAASCASSAACAAAVGGDVSSALRGVV